MKTKKCIGMLLAFLLILSGCVNNRGVVENPAIISRNTNALEIAKVEISDTATVLHIKAFYTPKNWIRIDSNSFLKDNLGKQYTIQSTGGIVLGEEFYMPDSGETEFTMIFPPVASNAALVDFSEGDFDGAWKIWGIQLTKRPQKVQLPKGFKEVAIDKNAVLPPVELKAGKARFEGQILNYYQGMPEEVSIIIAYPFGYPSDEVAFAVDEKGKFSGEIDAFSVHPVQIRWSGSRYPSFIAPGETTSLILNSSEISRRNSRLADNIPSSGEPVYYGGYLASLSKELSSLSFVSLLRRFYDNESYLSFFQTLGTKNAEELKTLFLDDYQAKKAILDTLDISPACKQILQCATDLYCAADIVNITSWVDRAYIFNNQLSNDREAILKYYNTRKFDLPDDFYSVLNDFPYLNDSIMFFAIETGKYMNDWKMNNLQPVLSKALGTGEGIIFDLIKVVDLSENIKNFRPVSEAKLEELSGIYRDFIRVKNDELLQLIEANKNKTGFNTNEIEDVAEKDVFPFILSKFKGKPLLIDFWATWCGPCKRANEELKPVKAELADKDIVYVFVAGENSPLEIWQNMISDLHGEHFRLSQKQWSYVGKTFGIEGVPTYFFIDREGNIKEKQVGYYNVQSMKEKILKLLKE